MQKIRPGWKRSNFDGRDFAFGPIDTALPQSRYIDLARHVVRDQGWSADAVPCCVSCAVTLAMEILVHTAGHDVQLSELYHYYQSREGSALLLSLDFRTGLKSAARGICDYVEHPWPSPHDSRMSRADALQQPSLQAEASSNRFKIGFNAAVGGSAYYRVPVVDRVNKWRAALSSGLPVIVGFWMTDAYRAITPAEPWHRVGPNSPSADGHAVVVCGYDDSAEAFLIRDSRGSGWGDGGCWALAYDDVDTALVEESWVIQKITP